MWEVGLKRYTVIDLSYAETEYYPVFCSQSEESARSRYVDLLFEVPVPRPGGFPYIREVSNEGVA